ncbi:hypothetical protein BG006_002453, partial [Podila minutissima]
FTSQGAHLLDIHAYFGGKHTLVLPALHDTESECSYGLSLESSTWDKEDKEMRCTQCSYSKSVVQHKLNIGFLGKTLNNNIILVNCLQTKLDLKKLTLEMCQKLMEECAAPTKLQHKDPTWLTYYSVNEHLAEHFEFKDRISITGDATHVHSPTGDQGMNTGMQDSHNLAWRLGLVLDSMALESILKTYKVKRKVAALVHPIPPKQNRQQALVESCNFPQGSDNHGLGDSQSLVHGEIQPYLKDHFDTCKYLYQYVKTAADDV